MGRIATAARRNSESGRPRRGKRKLTKKTISKAKPAAKPVKLKSGTALKTKARPIAHNKKAKPEPKKPEPKKLPVKPVKFVAKPAPKLPVKVAAKEPVKQQQAPAVKRSEEVKKTVSKPEPVRAVLGKESLELGSLQCFQTRNTVAQFL